MSDSRTDFLTPEQAAHVNARLAGTTLEMHGSWIAFDRDTVCLDGNYTTAELQLLADIMRTMPRQS